MHGQRIGYVRVSSFDQNPERQLEQIQVDKVFTDKASGKDTRRPELERLLGADFSTDGDRYAHREVIASLLAPWFSQRTLADVASAFAGSSVLWERYRSFTELAADPGFAANPLLREIARSARVPLAPMPRPPRPRSAVSTTRAWRPCVPASPPRRGPYVRRTSARWRTRERHMSSR